MSLPTTQSIMDAAAKPNNQILIDWNYYLSHRKTTLIQHEDTPPYLLLPEVEQLLDTMQNDVHRFLFDTLWHTGARISEALALTQDSFLIGERPYPAVVLPTLKSLRKTRGRPKKHQAEKSPQRVVALLDDDYIDTALRFFATQRPGKGAPLWPIDRRTADRWLKAAVNTLARQGHTLPLEKISCHTFRHSFAVNALVHGIDSRILQQWLGHTSYASTLVYTKVLNQHTGHLMGQVKYKR